MTFEFSCVCGCRMREEAGDAPRAVQCPKCGTKLHIPAAGTGSASAPAVPSAPPRAAPAPLPRGFVPVDRTWTPPAWMPHYGAAARPPERVNPQWNSTSWGRVALGVGVIILLGSILIALVSSQSHPPYRPNPPTPPVDSPLGSRLTDSDLASLTEFVANWTKAVRERSRNLEELYDSRRFAVEALRNEHLDARNPIGSEWFGTLAERNAALADAGLSEVLVRHAAYFGKRDEAVLAVRFVGRTGSPGKQRWWVTRKSGTWRIFDCETYGLRDSVPAGTFARWPTPAPGWAKSAPAALRSSAEAVERGDFGHAHALLNAERRNAIPPAVEAALVMAEARVSLRERQFEDALSLLDRATMLDRDQPEIHLLRATALNGLGRHGEALNSGRMHADRVGPDADGSEQIGRAIMGQRLLSDAADAFREGLKEDPTHVTCLVGLCQASNRIEETVDWFAQMPAPGLRFEALVSQLLACGRRTAAEAVIAEFSRISPNDPRIAEFSAKAAALPAGQ